MHYNRDAERAVLGAMLRDNRTADDVLAVVGAGDFGIDAHQRVFNAVVGLHSAGRPADLVTVADALAARNEVADVGYPYLGELLDAAPTAGNAVYYARIVRELALRRGLRLAGEKIIAEADSPTGTAEEGVELAEREVFALAESAVAGDVADAERAVAEVYDHIDGCHAARGNAGGTPTGFIDLDAKTGGLHPSALVLIAARPSVGKTALGAAIALKNALASRPVFFASLEQSRLELMERMMCSQAKVDNHALRKGLLGAEDMRRLRLAGDEIRQSPLSIDDAGRQSVLRIAANARRMKRRRGLALVVADYLQLIEPEDRRAQRYEQVGGISRRLKAMAKELAVPVVALCQLNRAVEDRAGSRPRLADLRESGSLEMDADTVLLLHRPPETDGVVEVIIGKQRNGPVGELRLAYLPHWTRFENFLEGPPLGD